MNDTQLIVYACPTGELAQQLAHYFEKSLVQCGANAAHRYMPHCTLTGFFHDGEASIPRYVNALEQSLAAAYPSRPASPIVIKALAFHDGWHGLELDSDWLKALVADFACRAHSPTRRDDVRLKDWLHLSLAYDFGPPHAEHLKHLAKSSVDTAEQAVWELRIYQRIQQEGGVDGFGKTVNDSHDGWEVYGGDRWRCHWRSPI